MKNKEFKKLQEGQGIKLEATGTNYVFKRYDPNYQIVFVDDLAGNAFTFGKKYVMIKFELNKEKRKKQ